jgi:uncharacterized protein (DUF2141 family)
VKIARFVCAFMIVGAAVFAVSRSWGHAAPSSPSQVQRSSNPQRGTGTLRATAVRRPSQAELSFAQAVGYGSGGQYARSVAVADVNGDGKLDLLVANLCHVNQDCSSGSVGVLLGNGDGTFQQAVSYYSGGYEINGQTAAAVAVADVNDDSKPDLIVTNSCINSSNCDGNVGVLLGNGDGTFQIAVTYSSGAADATSVAVADVNGDGKLDLVVGNLCTSKAGCDGTSKVGVLLGNGDGTFRTAVTYDPGGYETGSVALGDLNGDGKLDIVVADACFNGLCGTGNVGVLLGNGDGTFRSVVVYNPGGSPSSVALADVNGDGNLDVVVANLTTVAVLLGNGDGTLQPAVTYSSGGTVSDWVAVADVNGDSKPDVLVANLLDGTVGVLLGNGDGTFQPVRTYNPGGSASSVAVADVNEDGKPDLLVTNECANGNCGKGTVGVLINTSVGPTTTGLASSPNPSNFGQSVTFTATVTSQGFKIRPTGTVSFFDGKTKLGSSNVNSSGVAVLVISTLAIGTHSITAVYNGDTNFGSSTSPALNQVVQGAVVALVPPSLDFGNETVGTTSPPQVSTLKNTGNIALTITSISVTGANRADFFEKDNCGTSIPPGDTCKIGVTFTPSASGTRKADVSITDNAPNSPQLLPLKGVGVLPDVTFSPSSLDFSTQIVFTGSPAQPVTLTNTGLGILFVTKIGVTGPFEQTNNCPGSIDPGGKCTINVKFYPTTKGVQSGSVNVTDNAPDSPQKVPLKGTGTFVRMTPSDLHFGTHPVGTRSLPKKITLTNQGDSGVKIVGIEITGADAGDFAETNTCGGSVASGATCFIKVTFKPLVKGERTADVSVKDNGGGSPQKVKLNGRGT